MRARGNVKAGERITANLLSVIRIPQNRTDETQLALDLAMFVNGLPVVAVGRCSLCDRRGD